MNLFALEYDSIGNVDWAKSAQALDNLRVNKMLIETAQLLSTALHTVGVSNKKLYKPTHINHPSAKYTRASDQTFQNVCVHGLALLDEFQARFNKFHKSGIVIIEAYALSRSRLFGNSVINFVDYMAMPDQYRLPDPVESYRNFYASKPNLRYPKNKIPTWLLAKRSITSIVVI